MTPTTIRLLSEQRFGTFIRWLASTGQANDEGGLEATCIVTLQHPELSTPKPFYAKFYPDLGQCSRAMANEVAGYVLAQRYGLPQPPRACIARISLNGFLLTVAREALTTHGPSARISPHISFGEPRFAQGSSVEAVLDSMYRTVVTLGRRTTETAELLTPAERKAPRSTETIRKRIRRAFRQNDPKGFTDYWRDDPVAVPVDGHRRPIDMQIWQAQGGLFTPRCFGIIVSACYKDLHYRKAYLNGAYHDLTIARSYMQQGQGKGGIFILRPEDGDNLTQIDNEIDNTVWALQKKFQISPYVENMLDRLKEKALEFML